MDDLFDRENTREASPDDTDHDAMPLAARMRPQSLEDYVGQQHILGEGKLLRRAIMADSFSSLIFYGPPGVGKTSLARVIAAHSKSRFINLSGVESNVAEIRKSVEAANSINRLHSTTTTLFVDEIHRFNKAQQDVLLPHIERGTVRFIGATTHNPFFYINSPLVSRSQVFQLEPLESEDLKDLIHRAIGDKDRGLGKQQISISEDAVTLLVTKSDGDARKCLNALELGIVTTSPGSDGIIHFDLTVAEESIQQKTVVYDGDGDAHYDTISAFIKSMRGSDPDATLYWLAKMLYAGEDIRFIARRIVIAASEDVGLADSNALRVAIAAQQAADFIGLPEAQIPLAHAALYVATAPKSNRCYSGLISAQQDINEGRTLVVPKHLRDSHYKGAEQLGHGEEYLYSHNYEGGFVPQAYLPEGRRYYEPTENGQEMRIKQRLEYWREQFEQAKK
ncbi:MAG: replication-associated recombination protein A [Verrucomicrobiaceae bacterium]|nr:replication-associated recombination protein A [Verrucomicrobiaceae bacterium]